MNLKEKINYEWECFFLDQMRTSRENIFARSKEIELKRILYDELCELLETTDEQTKNFLLYQENILESAYRFCQDQERQHPKRSVRENVNGWLSFLMKK